MATTNFVPGTVIASTWLNDVDAATYQAANGITGSVDRTANAKFADMVSVKDFGAVGDGVTDDLAALNAAIAYEQTNKKGLYFPSGTYLVSSTLNFLGSALRDLRFHAVGKVTIYNTGSGNVATLDSGGVSARCNNIEFLGFILRGNALSTHGLYTRGLTQSTVKARAIDIATAGFRVEWSVSAKFDLRVSSNSDTFLINPNTGLIVTESTPGNYTANCRFHVIMEDPITNLGVDYVHGGLGNIFTGTCEGIPRGFRQRSTAAEATLFGIDFEQNSVYDMLIEGRNLTIDSCNSSSSSSSPNVSVAATAAATTFKSSYLRTVDLASASLATNFESCQFSDNVSLGITGTGPYKMRGCSEVDTSFVTTNILSDVLGASTTWTPTVTQGVAITGLTIAKNNYRVNGKTILIRAKITMGSAGTATNAVSIGGLPTLFPIIAADNEMPIGTFVYFDSSASTYYQGVCVATGVSTFTLQTNNVTGAFGTAPAVTIASPDVLYIYLNYEVA